MAHETTATFRHDHAVGVSAGRGRIITAVFVDYLLFSTLMIFSLYLYGLSLYGVEAASGPIAMKVQHMVGFSSGLVAFVVFEVIMFFVLKASLGRYLLGIGPDYSVDPQIHGRDSAVTILLSVVTLYGGLNQTVNWMAFVFPTPVFGFYLELGPLYRTLLQCMIGMFWVIAGFMLFRLNRVVLAVVFVGTVAEIVSVALSWQEWRVVGPLVLMGQQGAFGGDLLADEVAFVRDYVAHFMVGLSALYLLLVMAAAPRFLSRKEPVDS